MKHHLTFFRKNNEYKAEWNLLAVNDLQKEFFLSIENADGDKFEAYSVPGDERVPNFINYDFKRSGDSIFFKDFRTGLKYSAKLNQEDLALNFVLFGKNIAVIKLKKTNTKWNRSDDYFKSDENTNDDLVLASPESEGVDQNLLQILTDSATNGNLVKTHSILIARNGKLIYEKYFGGYNVFSVHDMRSASKSISSSVTGIAIDKGYIKNAEEYLYDYFPREYKKIIENDSSKRKIRLKDLLTMSSGLDAIDFGIERESMASEDLYQGTEDWAKTVLEAPMINPPGTQAYYGSANPFLLGLAVQKSVSEPLELFMHRTLFAKLGIENYLIQDDISGNVYFAGGMYMRPRDILKFGQLYLDSGKWNGEQIVSKEWVKDSFGEYFRLENTDNKNEYGYLWWHNKYKKGDEIIEAIEARGAGGQYIILIPKYNLVCVVTSGNYRNGKYAQPEKIMQEYILPAVR
jgi:CubicO group peptidase (beta-lactamase class C family)